MEEIEKDYELAFQIQMNYVIAASLGIGMSEDLMKEAAGSSNDGEVKEVARNQEMEVEAWQKEEEGRIAALFEAKLEGQKLVQIQNDRLLAQANASNPNAGLLIACLQPQSDDQCLQQYIRSEELIYESNKREICVLCAENRNEKEMVTVEKCSHRFCSYCMRKYCEIKIEEGKDAVCPAINCGRAMAEDELRRLISSKYMGIFETHMVESSIPVKERAYCPYKDCSVFISRPLGENADRLDCVECKRPFCLACQVPWHQDLSCKEFQKLPAELQDQDSAKLYLLSKAHRWKQCPKCGYFIELVAGCNHVTCRCSFQFCFKCGQDWFQHKQCRCDAWEESNILY